MKSKPLSYIIYIGETFWFLKTIDNYNGILTKDSLVKYFDDLLKSVSSRGLKTTIISLQDFKGFVDVLRKEEKDRILTNKERNNIKIMADGCSKTFHSEMQTINYYMPNIDIIKYPLGKLLDNPESLFRTDIFKILGVRAQYDIKEGCRCIAFNLPTSAAFHILRATEDIFRKYYRSIYTKDKNKNIVMGEIISKCRNEKTPKIIKKIDKGIIDRAEYIKNMYRNPTQHPEKIYEIEESQDLLNICIEFINAVMQNIKK